MHGFTKKVQKLNEYFTTLIFYENRLNSHSRSHTHRNVYLDYVQVDSSSKEKWTNIKKHL